MATYVYLDESGDTGWMFDRPYTQGGSSRYLIIAACMVPPDKDHKPERLLRHVYRHRKWNPANEKKWVRMSPEARTAFSIDAAKLVSRDSDVKLHAIVVDKRNVREHVRRDPNMLYNYMVKLLLLDEMAKHDRVCFVPDPRSIKVTSGDSLHDYLQTELWFGQGVETCLETTPRDSRYCLNLQFTDMLAGVVQSHFEFGEGRHWTHLREHVHLKRLFLSEVDEGILSSRWPRSCE